LAPCNVSKCEKPNEFINEKMNALNFLYEFLSSEIVRQLLEKSDDHLNILLLKLNQIVIENSGSSSNSKFYRIPLKKLS
jgi:hypothetical protein